MYNPSLPITKLVSVQIFCIFVNIVINWFYEEDDEDMEEEGHIFKDSFPKVEFNLIKVKDIKK